MRKLCMWRRTFMEPYLPILKTFVEGELPFAEFKIWFSANSEALQQALSRHDYLLLKHRQAEGATLILDQFGVAYQMNWRQCSRCGEVLFQAVPRRTTKQEIIKFATRMGWE